MRKTTSGSKSRPAYRQRSIAIAKLVGCRPVVVGTKPYFYTHATGCASLSIPESDDAYLLGYMDRYGASFVFLTESELDIWRPAWRTPSAVPEGLTPLTRGGAGHLFERAR